MEPAIKEQTAFRFDTDFLLRMKRRAKLQGKSVNRYVTELIERDLLEAEMFPRAVLSDSDVDEVKSFAGRMEFPSADELEQDERLERIWKR